MQIIYFHFDRSSNTLTSLLKKRGPGANQAEAAASFEPSLAGTKKGSYPHGLFIKSAAPTSTPTPNNCAQKKPTDGNLLAFFVFDGSCFWQKSNGPVCFLNELKCLSLQGPVTFRSFPKRHPRVHRPIVRAGVASFKANP